MTTTEAQAQVALFDLLTRLEGRWPLLKWVTHIPNGEKRDKATGARLKAMGVRRGCPDLIFPIRNRAEVWGYRAGVFSALAIELKAERGRLSPEQKAWGELLRAEGWAWGCCFDWTEAARLILTWVGGAPGEVEGL